MKNGRSSLQPIVRFFQQNRTKNEVKDFSVSNGPRRNTRARMRGFATSGVAFCCRLACAREPLSPFSADRVGQTILAWRGAGVSPARAGETPAPQSRVPSADLILQCRTPSTKRRLLNSNGCNEFTSARTHVRILGRP